MGRRKADGGRQEALFAALEALYAELPKMNCQGLCADSCASMGMTTLEQRHIRARTGQSLPLAHAGELCSALTMLRQCGIYEARPLICFLPDTLVHTPGGPRRIAEILAGDEVYGGDGRKHRVVATASRWYTGQIVNVRHSPTGMDCWSTADHRWFVASQKDKRSRPKPYWKEAGDLVRKRHHSVGDYLTFPAAFEDVPDLDRISVADYVGGVLSDDGLTMRPYTAGVHSDRERQNVPARIDVDDDFLYMLGIYLAEGSASIQTATFTLGGHEGHIVGRISAYLARLGIRSSVGSGRRNTLVLSVPSAVFARLMKALAGSLADRKAVDRRLWERLSHRQRWQVYLAWDEGDGRKCLREHEMSTTTISRTLAAQMAFAALGNGFFPRVYSALPSGRGNVNYDVHLFPSNWRAPKAGHGTKLMHDGEYVYTPVGSLDRRDYSGPVIDIQVDGAESFVTTSGIAHNCRIWGMVATMRCDYGCVPEGGWLSDAQAYEFLARVFELAGDHAQAEEYRALFREVPAEVRGRVLRSMQKERDLAYLAKSKRANTVRVAAPGRLVPRKPGPA